MAISLEILTDEAILDYTRDDGKDRILTDHRDINLQHDGISAWPGGVYDVMAFGSPMEDRCICGYTHRKPNEPSTEPCPRCGARVFSREDGLRRFARIELPFYYLNELRFEVFKSFFDDVFSGSEIKLDFMGDDLKRNGYSSARGGKKLGIKVFDTCQFTYSATKKRLTISEFITDLDKCSYEGIMAIIEKHFPNRLNEYKKLINRYYLVLPVMMRPFSLTRDKDGTKKMGTHKLSTWYSSIIYFCVSEDKKANQVNYEETINSFKTPGEKARYNALLRAYLNVGKKEATTLLNTSKKNAARQLYAVRTPNSARCYIVPSTTLAIDEIGVPTSVAYEMCREGFIKHLMNELNFTEKEARKATKEEALNPETQKMFKEYAEKQIVLINRQPTLHEYSTFAMKLRCFDDTYAIQYPIAVCGPLNADFDGDCITLQLVPESAAQDTYEKMSPRYVNVYKKNNNPIFVFNHETLNGLCVATEYTPEDPMELKEPRYYYTDYVELLKDVEVNRKIKISTPILFTGKIGSVDYVNKVTCYGRIRLSKIIDADIDKIGIFKDITNPIHAPEAGKLSGYLNNLDDGVEKRLAIQKFALRAVTLAGVVTFDFKTLYADTNTELYKEIRNIADSKELTDQQKLALLTEKYAKYEKEIQGKYTDDLKKELSRAGRVKLTSISSMGMPQLIVSGVDEKPVITRGSLLTGYDEEDMIYHSIENRSLLSIKNGGVPVSGYLTRQLSFLLNSYVYHSEGEDTDNPGILIPRYKALGRTAPNGEVYPTTFTGKPSEDDLVPVRSIVTKRKGDLNTITPDLIGIYKFKDLTDGSALGISFATSLTESITQEILGLKHGGHERVLDKTGYLKAPKACTFREEGKFIYLKVRGKELKYPRPSNLVTLGKDKFEEGENVCCAYITSSPIMIPRSLIKVINAKAGKALRYYEKDDIITSDCYAFEDGTIHYVETKEGYIDVVIGNRHYIHEPRCMYYFPDGAEVKKFDRICSGVVNMNHVIAELGTNINDIYTIFRKQFYSLTDSDFISKGVTSPGSTQEEIIELVFTGLTKTDYNPNTSKIDQIQYLGVQNSILNGNSFYTMLSYGYGARIVNKAIKGDINLSDDIITNTVLGLLLNDKLDNK